MRYVKRHFAGYPSVLMSDLDGSLHIYNHFSRAGGPSRHGIVREADHIGCVVVVQKFSIDPLDSRIVRQDNRDFAPAAVRFQSAHLRHEAPCQLSQVFPVRLQQILSVDYLDLHPWGKRPDCAAC